VSDEIRIQSLVPQPLPDLGRVSLALRVSGLPAYGHGVGSGALHFADMPQPEEANHDGQPTQAPVTSNVVLFPQEPPSNASPVDSDPTPGDDRPPSPFPDVALSILDRHGTEVSGTFVIEHKEPDSDFTLHLRTVEPGAPYVARAEMTLNDEVIQVVEVPFELK